MPPQPLYSPVHVQTLLATRWATLNCLNICTHPEMCSHRQARQYGLRLGGIRKTLRLQLSRGAQVCSGTSGVCPNCNGNTIKSQAGGGRDAVSSVLGVLLALWLAGQSPFLPS